MFSEGDFPSFLMRRLSCYSVDAAGTVNKKRIDNPYVIHGINNPYTLINTGPIVLQQDQKATVAEMVRGQNASAL